MARRRRSTRERVDITATWAHNTQVVSLKRCQSSDSQTIEAPPLTHCSSVDTADGWKLNNNKVRNCLSPVNAFFQLQEQFTAYLNTSEEQYMVGKGCRDRYDSVNSRRVVQRNCTHYITNTQKFCIEMSRQERSWTIVSGFYFTMTRYASESRIFNKWFRNVISH